MKPETLIINRPDLLKSHQKYTAIGVTLFFWGALIYLWQPAISLIAWTLNLNIFYEHMVVLGGYKNFFHLLAIYSGIIIVLVSALLLWAKVNQWRFTGIERRKDIGITSTESVANTFNVSQDSLEQWQSCHHLIVDVDENGLINKVTP
ncbi:MAG: biofilm PGA synthesis protein PgaD [Pseudohongiellaceae bacterium]|jgi:biofilm PGA synthesis protein PgaD